MNFKSHLQEVWCDGFFCHGLRFMMMKIYFPRLVATWNPNQLRLSSFKIISKTNFPEWNSSESLAEDAPRALQLSQSLRAKRQGNGDFEERIFKNNTVLVINCSGNIHTGEIVFHFNCDIMVVDRAGKSFLFWKLQGKNEFQIVIFSFRWLS